MSKINEAIRNRLGKLKLLEKDGTTFEKQNALFLINKLKQKYNIDEKDIIEYVPKTKEVDLNTLFEDLDFESFLKE